MKFIKKFEKFLESSAAEPQVDPGKTKVAPGKPLQKPNRPSPIKRENPSPVPLPAKAEVDEKDYQTGKTVTATAEQVADRFIDLMVQGNEDVKKYTKLI